MQLDNYHQEWLDYHGLKVLYEGRAYRLEARSFTPVHGEDRITVFATPVNKSSKMYREVKRTLGDDWSTDVLNSTIEIEWDFLQAARKAFDEKDLKERMATLA